MESAVIGVSRADAMFVISDRPPVATVAALTAGRRGRDGLALVGADLEREAGGAEDGLPLNLVSSMMLLTLLGDLGDLGGDRVLVVVVEGAVVELHLQVTDALQHRVHLGEGTFRGLDQRDAVLRVALRLGEAADLAAHLLRDAPGRQRRPPRG